MTQNTESNKFPRNQFPAHRHFEYRLYKTRLFFFDSPRFQILFSRPVLEHLGFPVINLSVSNVSVIRLNISCTPL